MLRFALDFSAGYVACGALHTAVLRADGAMLTFGSGSAGALGHGTTHYVLTPTPVGALRGHAIHADGAGSSPRCAPLARPKPPSASL